MITFNTMFEKRKYKGPMNPEEKAKIVATVEKRLSMFIMTFDNLPIKIERKIEYKMERQIKCNENCSCAVCFDRRLDLLLQTSTEAVDVALEQVPPLKENIQWKD